jgi:hypothetical protein
MRTRGRAEDKSIKRFIRRRSARHGRLELEQESFGIGRSEVMSDSLAHGILITVDPRRSA